MANHRILLNRRAFMLAAAFMPLAGRANADGVPVHASFRQRLKDLEIASGGRLGVAVFDSVSGVLDGYRLEERFPFCSTFKVILVAAVLSRVDSGRERLDRFIPYASRDLLDYAPSARRIWTKGD